jgi:non-specific serine/threonine protein kinase/serine/threonine-protein kinase
MNAERWQRVKQLLQEAVALDALQRSAFLARECMNDSELRSEVDSLLASHDQAGTGFMETPAGQLQSPATAVASAPARVGRRIGAYTILEEIGHGGMGEVYRAVRADGQYTKEVAVKLVRGGFDRASILDRFRNERQILASLDHANIARLLDGGTTDDGIPYLVMELIEGAPVDTYCDAHKLSITLRLQLFRQVCAAVQYAHQRLVIHRDIKPSNVLVTQDGLPKLLDFGIAKILDPTGDAQTTMTQAMTPEYASPEQIRGEAITTASDVYSLGVVLYQLLTGRSPYPAETRSPHEFARAICETEPGRPSTVVLKGQASTKNQSASLTPEAISSTREGSPARLRRRLAGDIDNIVLKALRKEPALRYISVEQLEEDIRRHLEGLPVTASKGSWKYRTAKFVARHKVGVAAAAAVFLALAAGIGATLREAHIARQQAEIAKAERARAEKRFDDVRKLANSLVFEIHDSIQNLPGATPARKLLLDRAVEYLDKLSKDASGDIDLQRELAWGYQRLAAVQGDTTEPNLDQISAAEVSTRKATALFEAVARANPRNVTDQLNVAMVYRTQAFADMYTPKGRKEIDLAMAVTEPLMQTDGTKVEVKNERAVEYQVLAGSQDAAGDRTQAVESYRKLLALKQDILRTNPEFHGIRRSVAKASVILGYQLAHVGSRQEALQLMQTGITDYEALVKAEGTPDVVRELAASQLRFGEVQLMDGNPKAARASFAQARAAEARLLKLDPGNTLLQSDLWGLEYDDGRALGLTGNYAQALAAVRRAAHGFESMHLEGDTGPGAGPMQIWIGEAQAGMRNYPEALKSYQKAVTALTKDQGMYDDARCDLATAYTKIGSALLKMGKLSEASDAYTKALDTANLTFSLQHQDIAALYPAADAYAGLGDVSATLARKAHDTDQQARYWNDARNWYEKSLSTFRKIPNSSRMSPDGFLARDPHEVAQALASVPQK